MPPEQLPAPVPVTVAHTHPLAVVSLLASLSGLTILPTIGSLVGIVLGHISHHEIQVQPQRYIGNGWAVGGIVLGWMGLLIPLAVAVAGIAVWLFVFGGLAAVLIFLGLQ